eukprot:TRINITY_DN7324_c0_g2_i2.p2 TRINITY_DN7324_c0_g2~~TRINITY_DN7324_c0_g2_i2.p2  ORF type:complete len:174 (+),score=100.73 TRINITY_DN7324_c0_g2_i2:305-826(+)
MMTCNLTQRQDNHMWTLLNPITSSSSTPSSPSSPSDSIVTPSSPSSPLAISSLLSSNTHDACPIEWRWNSKPKTVVSPPSSPSPVVSTPSTSTASATPVAPRKTTSTTTAATKTSSAAALKVAQKPIAKRRQRPRQLVFFSTKVDPVSGKFCTTEVPEPFVISFHMVQPNIQS